MSRSIQRIIEEVKADRFDDRLVDFQGTCRFDIAGVGSYLAEVDHGRMHVGESHGPADCVITCDPEDFVRLLSGELNLLTAFMQGRIGVEGDVAVAKLVHGLLPAQPGDEGREVRP
jgi:putative sterol carrier protein